MNSPSDDTALTIDHLTLLEMQRQLQRLSSEVAALRRQSPPERAEDRPASPPTDTTGMSTVTDRRGMLKTVGALAAGVAAVGLLRPTGSSAAPRYLNGGGKEGASPNATGGNFIIGQSNFPSNVDQTALIAPNSVVLPVLLRIDNYTTGSVSPPANTQIAGLFHTNNSGGTPTSGTFYGVYSQAEAAAGGNKVGVYGLAGTVAAPSGDGVVGAGGRGVVGLGFGSGCGVDGSVPGTSTGAFGVLGTATAGVGGAFAGGRAAIVVGLGTGAVANPNANTPNGGSIGDIYFGLTSAVWYNAGGTNPYRKLAGNDTAGAVHILATPVRYLDTRVGSPPTGPFSNGQVRVYNFIALQAGTIPAGARGVFGNITAASPGGAGNFQTNTSNSFPAGAASVINFVSGVNLSNHFVGALDTTGQLFVKGNILNGSGQTHLVIDIQGYFI